MKLIVGLGNPDRKYAMTRHNFGFMVGHALAEQNQASLSKSAVAEGLAARFTLKPEQCSLLLPMTYMNNSGVAVRAQISKMGISPEDILVVYDDMSIHLGQMRLRTEGSAGGHNGIKSIIEHLGTKEFPRLKLGVGRPGPKVDPADYVLSDFTAAERKSLPDIINKASLCVHCWVTEGAAIAMNQFNTKETNA